MNTQHSKSVRRQVLLTLYEHFQKDPLEMLSPNDLLAAGNLSREDLVPNAFYLHDRGLIELMIGYNPPMFAAARITGDGIDLVENHFEFNLRFPGAVTHEEEGAAEIPYLLERLVEEADCCALDGERRRCLLRDIQYLRDEVARPIERWRHDVVKSLLRWIEGHFNGAEDPLPSLARTHERICTTIDQTLPNHDSAPE